MALGKRIESKDRVAIALLASKLAKEALAYIEVSDSSLAELRLRLIAESFADLDKYVRKVNK
jgi:hypothetical protein